LVEPDSISIKQHTRYQRQLQRSGRPGGSPNLYDGLRPRSARRSRRRWHTAAGGGGRLFSCAADGPSIIERLGMQEQNCSVPKSSPASAKIQRGAHQAPWTAFPKAQIQLDDAQIQLDFARCTKFAGAARIRLRPIMERGAKWRSSTIDGSTNGTPQHGQESSARLKRKRATRATGGPKVAHRASRSFALLCSGLSSLEEAMVDARFALARFDAGRDAWRWSLLALDGGETARSTGDVYTPRDRFALGRRTPGIIAPDGVFFGSAPTRLGPISTKTGLFRRKRIGTKTGTINSLFTEITWLF
jgi:hypothetical protein